MTITGLASEGMAYLGMLLILGAFILETNNFLDSKNWIYLTMMASGSGLLAIRALLIDEWAFLILEVFWCIAAVAALVSIKQKKSG